MIVTESLPKIIPLKLAIDRLSISRATIYAKINPKSRWYDPTFPKPIKIGKKTGWIEIDLVDWLKNCKKGTQQ